MRILAILALFALVGFADQAVGQDIAKVDVIKFNWNMYNIEYDGSLLPLNTNSARRPTRSNPSLEKTVEQRSRDLAVVERSLTKSGEPGLSDFYLYELKVKNSDTKTIKSLFWEYQASNKSKSPTVFIRQFICAEKIKPNDSKTLKTISFLPPIGVVDASVLRDKDQRNYAMDIIINRIEYTDGTVWQRTGWDSSKIKSLDSPEITDTLKFNDCALL
ncbi:MAG TPA: hypothetical protein VK892_21130 [Pyrinomonadaceae bacterium]|nr:hypothetical protein [Pyrinomonadaceae bacterium]